MDIIKFLTDQEPMKSWTKAKKDEMLDLYCSARGYLPEYKDLTGKIVKNNQSKKDFVNEDMLRYLLNICNNEKKRQVLEASEITEFSV